MKGASLLILLELFVLLLACSAENGKGVSEVDQYDEYPAQQVESEQVTSGATLISFENGKSDNYYHNELRVSVRRTGLELDTAIKYNAFILGVSIKIPFTDISLCNYSNTHILYDGNPLQGELVGDTEFVAQKFMESYTENHVLEIHFDSLNCKNVRERYTLVPSECAGRVVRPEVGFDFSEGSSSLDNFSVRVFPDFYWPDYYVYGDTINSKCFLKTALDSLKLNMFFAKHDIFEKNYPSAVATASREDIETLLRGDDIAILKCTLAYQTWIVPAMVSTESYYNRRIEFKE